MKGAQTLGVFLIVVISLAVFLGALTRSVFGFGDSIVSMPLLALLPISLATSISLIGITGLITGTLAIFSIREHIDRRILFLLVISSLIGVPAGLYLVKNIPQENVIYILGIFLMIYGIYSLIKGRLNIKLPNEWKDNMILPLPFGFLAGALGSAYNMNGVPIVVYGTFRDWDMETFHSTVQSHFAISSLLVVLGQAFGGLWSRDLIVLTLASLPAIYIADKIGQVVRRRISIHQFEVLLFIFIIVLGLSLVQSSKI